MSNAVVAIMLGSKSDLPFAQEAERVLGRFGVGFETVVLSAHRMPDATAEFARTARARGLRVIIAMAGLAAHLPGVVASHTTLPVLGVPLSGGVSGGLDALLSIVSMPGGVPVGCLALDKHGARNAALLAVQILATTDADLERRLQELKRELAAGGSL
jgi:5-(carboxyamino)imidazole ribonucleotide mutase